MNNNSAITELETVEKDLLEKLKSVQSTLVTLKSMYNNSAQSVTGNISQPSSSNKYSDYDKNVTFREKVLYIFKKENRFLHVRELSEILHTLEPNQSIKEIAAKLSPAISFFKNQKVIVKITIGTSNLNTFWGSKNWIESDGTAKEKHMYDINQINYARKTEEISI